MEFFSETRAALLESDPRKKGALVEQLYTNLKQNKLTFDHDAPVSLFEQPSYAPIVQIVRPRDVPKRRHFDNREGQGILLHAIAHIEYSAIDLALDSAYRFRHMPREYYRDWIEVADDEVRHFRMLEELMKKAGVRYGDYPVHTALFDAGKKSGKDILERMAVIPRYLEANGLDANPKIIRKLRNSPPDAMLDAIAEALEVILEEEVVHVAKGDRWFKYVCAQRGIDPSVYFEIIERFYPGMEKRHPQLNIEARRAAGFACEELKRMGAEKCE
ncbi:ferritin-like domain-containing protein [Hydrogenimonas urashimensis]|uniref:ferritin-like domain-containing protein n=1 Tax=Hydrogenimonas urashimensis TaxID=2740515 RepID=UPI00191553C4|nr:ferritin-like domain-containing protein [Hydrogenimonas urashimensis]